MKHSSHKGFSLIEMLVYIAVLSVVFIVVVATVLSFTGSYRTLSVLRHVEHSATISLERITRDIRAATSIDTGNSTLGTSPGVLTLITSRGGVSTTTRFYVDTGVLKVDVNGSYVGPLTGSNVVVTNLVFTQLSSGTSYAVKIDMTLQASVGTTVRTNVYHTTIILKGS